MTDGRVLGRALPKDIRHFRGVVDLGCGPGLLGKYLSQFQSLAYIGIDNSETMLKRAKKTLRGYRATLILDDIAHYTHTTNLNDFLCVIKNTLHLIPNYVAVIGSLGNRLGVERIVIIETVSPDKRSAQWVRSLF